MKLWKNCRMETYYGSKDSLDTDRCLVKFGDGQIVVSYDYGTDELPEPEVYEGIEIGQGHFKLKSQDGRGEANLHCFPDGRVLDGWWREDEYSGMWRIYLSDWRPAHECAPQIALSRETESSPPSPAQ